jgi:hypothetical protein
MKKLSAFCLVGVMLLVFCGSALARDIIWPGGGSRSVPSQASQASQQKIDIYNPYCYEIINSDPVPVLYKYRHLPKIDIDGDSDD